MITSLGNAALIMQTINSSHATSTSVTGSTSLALVRKLMDGEWVCSWKERRISRPAAREQSSATDSRDVTLFSSSGDMTYCREATGAVECE